MDCSGGEMGGGQVRPANWEQKRMKTVKHDSPKRLAREPCGYGTVGAAGGVGGRQAEGGQKKLISSA